MPARVNEALVLAAADALLLAAKSLTNESGLKIICAMTQKQAQSAIMGAIVAQSGLHYSHAVAPTGWTEIDWSSAPKVDVA